MEKYTEYATRSENIRNPERRSHGNVARKRYKRIDHCDQAETLGQGCTTGHQKRKPAPKNDACSTACHSSECIPNVNSDGTCQPRSVSAETIQHNSGRESARPKRCTDGRRNSGLSTFRADPGNRFQKHRRGSPKRIKAGAKVISSKCWTIWTVSK